MSTRALLLLGLLVCAACAASRPAAGPPPNDALMKVTFDLTQLDADGLIGPPNGKRTLSYEFCIPVGQRYQDEVRAIDPSVEFQPGSRGRIGCGPDQTLAIGSTGQPNWREVLRRLAALDYITRIDQAVFE